MFTVQDILTAVDLLKQNQIGQLPTEGVTGWFDNKPTHLMVGTNNCLLVLFGNDEICWSQTFYLMAKSQNLDPLYYLGLFLMIEEDPVNAEQGRKIVDNFKTDKAIDMLKFFFKWKETESQGVVDLLIATTSYLCYPHLPISPYIKFKN